MEGWDGKAASLPAATVSAFEGDPTNWPEANCNHASCHSLPIMTCLLSCGKVAQHASRKVANNRVSCSAGLTHIQRLLELVSQLLAATGER